MILKSVSLSRENSRVDCFDLLNGLHHLTGSLLLFHLLLTVNSPFSLFFRNSRLLTLAICLIIVSGLAAVHTLPRLEDPQLAKRAGKILTRFPGASAERVESLVTEKIEQELKEIEEIRVIRSGSRKELSTITMELHDHISDVDEVWSRIRDKLNDVEPQLPPGASKPQFEDLHFKAYALLVALSWDRDEPVNYSILRRQAEELEQRFRRVFGTDIVDTFGAPSEEILVQVDADKLLSLNVTIEQVAQLLQSSDAKVSAGGLRSATSEAVVELKSEFKSLADVGITPIKLDRQNRLVRLSDVAEITKGIQQPFNNVVLINGQPAIVLGCMIQPEMRIDRWNAQAIKVFDGFRQELPSGISATIRLEQNRFVMLRLETLLQNLALGAVAVTLVIFVMMGWRSAIVVGLALPLSMMMVLSGLRLLGIPLHQMSVTGLIIALGLLIDNAIVVVDETRANLRKGMAAAIAIQSSVRYLAIPLFGSTFTTALAFAPLALMPGPAGEFVGAIGMSVILAVASSLFISLTIIPSLLGRIENSKNLQRASHWWQSGIGGVRIYSAYRATLDMIFARPLIGLALGLILPIIGFAMARHLPEQFFPASDRNQFQISLIMSSQSSIEDTRRVAERIREIALELDEIERVDWFLGQSAPAFYYNMLPLRTGVPSYAQAFVETRIGVDVPELINRLQKTLDRETGEAQVLVKQLEQGPPVDAPILLRIYGNDFVKLRELGDQVRAIIANVPNVVMNVSDMSSTARKVQLVIDEDKARQVGLTHLEIARQTAAAMDGLVGGSVLEDTEELPIRIRWSVARRSDSTELNSIEIITSAVQGRPAQRIPLAAIAKEIRVIPDDSTIERMDGQRMNEIQVSVTAGILASQVLHEIQQRVNDSEIEIPPSYAIDFAGESAERNRAVDNLMASAGILVVLMLAILVLSFQSFRIAGLISVVAALSVGVGLSAIWLYGYSIGFMAIVGIMGLVGVAINDSIVVLAAIRADAAARRGERDAISRVVFRASRHVLSTTLTTIAGFSPLLIRGGGFWPPLAIAIAGGVAGATILALYFVPAAYILIMSRRRPAPMAEVGIENDQEHRKLHPSDREASVA